MKNFLFSSKLRFWLTAVMILSLSQVIFIGNIPIFWIGFVLLFILGGLRLWHWIDRRTKSTLAQTKEETGKVLYQASPSKLERRVT